MLGLSTNSVLFQYFTILLCITRREVEGAEAGGKTGLSA